MRRKIIQQFLWLKSFITLWFIALSFTGLSSNIAIAKNALDSGSNYKMQKEAEKPQTDSATINNKEKKQSVPEITPELTPELTPENTAPKNSNLDTTDMGNAAPDLGPAPDESVISTL